MRAWATIFGTVLVLFSAGCGDDSERRSSGSTPPVRANSAAIESSVSTVLDTCISGSFDGNPDMSKINRAVDALVREFKRTPDYPLGETDIKATTVREAVQVARDLLEDCHPPAASRLNQQLDATPPQEVPEEARQAEKDRAARDQAADERLAGSVAKFKGPIEQKFGEDVKDVSIDQDNGVLIVDLVSENADNIADSLVSDICSTIRGVDADVRVNIRSGFSIIGTCGSNLKSPGSGY